MAASAPCRVPTLSLLFDVSVAAAAAAALATVLLSSSPQLPAWPLWVAVPVVIVMARWPVVLVRDTSGIEIGLDSAVLMFLAFAAPASATVAVWGTACVASQLATRKSLLTRMFNIGVTVLAGVAAIAAVNGLRASGVPGPRDLVAAAAGGIAYFAVDYLLSAFSVALVGRTALRAAVWDVNTPISASLFGGVAALGYLSAIVVRHEPWALPLMALPVGTVVLATKAFGAAHADRVLVRGLFTAATQTQRGDTESEIISALLTQAGRVLRCPSVHLGDEPSGEGELSVELPAAAGASARWLVAAPRLTGGPFSPEDRRALDALAAIAAESLQRAALVGELAHLARHDPLTGLANRTVFRSRVAAALLDRRAGGPPAVLFCDLDGFKAVNDTLGHAAGDALLVAIAARFSGCIRSAELVARLGGDEFAVLLPAADRETALKVADRLLSAAAQSLTVAGRRVQISASVGVALPADLATAAEDPDGLLRAADVAMYEAKTGGKNCRVLFHESMLTTHVDRIRLADELREAAERGELTVEYQPVLDLVTGHVDGFEALVRWAHPTRGLLQPAQFIPLAEDTGLVERVGAFVLDQALADGRRFAAVLGRQLCMAVNVAAQQLHNSSLLSQIPTGRADGVQLVVEITETSLVQPAVVPLLRALRDRGVRIVMDDFGIGHSSIAHLRLLPLDGIKLDQAFTADVAVDGRAADIVYTVAMMAKRLGLSLVAEGIENAAQEQAMRALGCNLGQGYHLARPMSADAAYAYVCAHVDSAARSAAS